MGQSKKRIGATIGATVGATSGTTIGAPLGASIGATFGAEQLGQRSGYNFEAPIRVKLGPANTRSKVGHHIPATNSGIWARNACHQCVAPIVPPMRCPNRDDNPSENTGPCTTETKWPPKTKQLLCKTM